jgi:hypothetical protein
MDAAESHSLTTDVRPALGDDDDDAIENVFAAANARHT